MEVNQRTDLRVLKQMLDALIEADMCMDFKSNAGDEGEVPFFTKFHYTNIINQEKIYNPSLEIDADVSFNEYLAMGIIKEVPGEAKYGLNNPFQEVYYIVPGSQKKIRIPRKWKDENVPKAVKDNQEWWDG